MAFKEFIVTTGASAHANNGGGYNPATYVGTLAQLLGTDDGPVCAPTDATGTVADGVWTKAGAFVNAQVGMYAHVVSGTHATPGWYVITARTDNTITIATTSMTENADHGDGVIRVGGAFTFAGAVASAYAATGSKAVRVNVKAGAYSIGATTLPTGTGNEPIVFRGYSTALGDLDGQGRNADGTLNTTNMPDITITAAWTPGPHCTLQNMDLTGALSSALVSSSTVDKWALQSCRLINTQNNAAAACVLADDLCLFSNCDFACTGAAHGIVVDADNYTRVSNCRFSGVAAAYCLNMICHEVINCTFLGNGTASGVNFQDLVYVPLTVANCTFYQCDIAIKLPNSGLDITPPAIVNSHVTDCAKYISGGYVATADTPVIEAWNRTRDNTTPRTGILSAVLAGEVTTDTGGAETDYHNAAAGDLRLISSAPGLGAGMVPGQHIGACPPPLPRIPVEAKVEDEYDYGYYDELTGTLAGGGGGARPIGQGGLCG